MACKYEHDSGFEPTDHVRGKAIALRLASDGYDICINDVEANKAGVDEVVSQIKSMGRKSCAAIADVSDLQQVEEMVQTSVKELGPLNTMSVLLFSSMVDMELTPIGSLMPVSRK